MQGQWKLIQFEWVSTTYVAVAVVKRVANPFFSQNIRRANDQPAHLLPPALWGILPVYGGGVQKIFFENELVFLDIIF